MAAKFKVGDKVRLVLGYRDGRNENWTDGSIGEVFTIANIIKTCDIMSWVNAGESLYSMVGVEYIVTEEMLELVEDKITTQKISLDNTKIDVQKYADKYNLTLEQAHNEVQTWLFEQGYVWPFRSKTFANKFCCFLFTGSYDKKLSFTNSKDYFLQTKNREIILDRVVAIVPKYVELELVKETVEIDGVKYYKDEVLSRLSELKPVE